ncbi:hypothetical protein B0H19DRAFT_140938 [Mycena capillaripes]|nr:hypothetical protein B0H19DRAFT_140938 [Mycena capillaripes]
MGQIPLPTALIFSIPPLPGIPTTTPLQPTCNRAADNSSKVETSQMCSLLQKEIYRLGSGQISAAMTSASRNSFATCTALGRIRSEINHEYVAAPHEKPLPKL